MDYEREEVHCANPKCKKILEEREEVVMVMWQYSMLDVPMERLEATCKKCAEDSHWMEAD